MFCTKSDSKQIIPITFFWMFILKCKKKAYIYFTLFHNSFYNLFYLILGCNFFHYTFFFVQVYCISLESQLFHRWITSFVLIPSFFSLYLFLDWERKRERTIKLLYIRWYIVIHHSLFVLNPDLSLTYYYEIGDFFFNFLYPFLRHAQYNPN